MKIKNLITLLGLLALIVSCNKNSKNMKTGYSGEDISNLVSIQRDKSTKKATFESKLTDKWELYVGSSVDSINFTKPLLTGTGSGSFPLDVPTDKRSYFQVVSAKGNALLAERHLPMTGGFNFRDIGGYKTKDGKFVKWGKIFRSDDLSTLTDADLSYLSSFPLLSVVDYRSAEEIKAAPDKIPTSVKNDETYSINPGNVTSPTMLKNMDNTKIDAYMEQINVKFVSDSAAISQFRKMFEMLQNPTNNVPLLYHCTAGKDRTGMSTALILYALGVDDKTVMDDYLTSNQFIEAKFAAYEKTYPEMRDMFLVKKDFLQAGLDQIKKEYGNVENFLTKQLNVDLKKFRELYLY